MAKKSMIIKANRTPKFSTRKVTAARFVDGPAVICGNSKCAGFAFGSLPVRADPWRYQIQLVGD
jgi:hypothetical protein